MADIIDIDPRLAMLAAFVTGWWLRGRLSALAISIGMRLLVSKAGKRATLSALRDGLLKLDGKGKPPA